MPRVTVLALLSLFSFAPCASASILFDSGTYSGAINAWDVSLNSAPVADSFLLSSDSTITGVGFVVWTNPGDVMSTVDWSIVSSPSSGTTYASGTSTPVSQTLLTTPSIYGYDIDLETFAVPSVALSAGTYWLKLQNANDANSNLYFWDENDNPNVQAWDGGFGYLNNTTDPNDCAVGQSCSETFTISGTATQSPEPGSFILFGFGCVAIWFTARRTSRSFRA